MSAEYRQLFNTRSGQVILPRTRLCTSFWCHFKGLQLVRDLPDDEGLLFVNQSESIVSTTIHMFFMFITIGVVWLDSQGRVVDKKLARPWRPAYAPQQPAQYFIEANPDLLERVEIGDVLSFEGVAASA